MLRYFAYGSNMSSAKLAHVGVRPASASVAVLADYELTFPLYSSRW